MKKLTVVVASLLVLCAVSVCAAAQNISGIWAAEGSQVTNAQVGNVQLMYAQNGNNVQVVGFFEVNGAPYVWHGSGTLKGNALEYSVIYSKNPDSGDGPNGKHVMTLSADGQTVTGNWYNNYGASGTTRYTKQK